MPLGASLQGFMGMTKVRVREVDEMKLLGVAFRPPLGKTCTLAEDAKSCVLFSRPLSALGGVRGLEGHRYQAPTASHLSPSLLLLRAKGIASAVCAPLQVCSSLPSCGKRGQELLALT